MHTRTAETDAERTAADVAAAAGVRIAEVTRPREASELAALLMQVWQTSYAYAPVSSDLICAFADTGQYVVTARRENEVLGGAVGFRTDQDGSPRLYSHIAGVLPSAQGHHVGFALKLHQRAWAQQRGVVAINWTFDPLVRRNAYFNLTKLGASAGRYHVNAYGDMADPINAGDPSDRYVADWPVGGSSSPAVAAPPDDADVVLRPAADGSPAPAEPERGRPLRLAWIPEDILDIRRREPELALRWRLALRAALVAAMEDGFVAAAMTRDGWYVLERRP